MTEIQSVALPTKTLLVDYVMTSVFDIEEILTDAPFTREQITEWYVKYDTLYIYWTDANGEEQCEEYAPIQSAAESDCKHPHDYRDGETYESITD